MTFTTLIDAESLRELVGSAAAGATGRTPAGQSPYPTQRLPAVQARRDAVPPSADQATAGRQAAANQPAVSTPVAANQPAAGGQVTGAPVLLDCRFDLSDPGAGHRAYLTGHIPGARYVDLNRHLSAPVTADSGRHPLPSAADLRDLFCSLGIGEDTQAVAYDEANGSLAARAWWLLRWLGHSQVAVLDGGFKGWLASGGAVEHGEPPRAALDNTVNVNRPRAGFEASHCRHARTQQSVPAASAPGDAAGFTTALRPATASTVAVLRALQDPNRLLVDARAAERFAGSVEPMDPVAGHVPGAINHPFGSNLRSDGYFLSATELRRRWLERLAGTAPADVIMMCGSGVTACHNLLAMEIAGLPGAALYAGSWSEWIRDPQRPVARGND
ncbi:MAG: sulfurtransferase [Pseudomonadota bacterium]|nr:sulfurtransferase [Pseudomonadota bacterium]